MAYYVQYTPDVYPDADQDNQVYVWWFPAEFSQSQLGDRVLGSNACTLIAVLAAARIHEFNIQIWGLSDQPLTRMLVSTLAEAIVEGNELHEQLALTGQLEDLNGFMNVPEAIDAAQNRFPFLTEWTERTTTIILPLGQTLAQSIRPTLYEWVYNPPPNKKPNADLFIILVANTRTVLFVYQPQLSKIALIDSHSHTNIHAGCVVAQSRVGDLEQLCEWYVEMCLQSFGQGPNVAPYELAFLYVQDPG